MIGIAWARLEYISMHRRGEKRFEGAEHIISEGYLGLVRDKDVDLVMATSSRGEV